MSELIQHTNQRLERLITFAGRLIDGENGKMLFGQYQNDIENIDAHETMQLFDQLLADGYPVAQVKAFAGKLVNLFYKSLNAKHREKPAEGHFLYYMMLENRGVEAAISEVKPWIKSCFDSNNQLRDEARQQLSAFVERIKEYELHYIKKENILFPWLEKSFTQHRCLQLMWSFHDDFRKSVKQMAQLLQQQSPDKVALNHEIGKLFFVVLPIIFREEQIVFPVALRAIPEKGWDDMLQQSRETGWCYGVAPRYRSGTEISQAVEGTIDLGTGSLTPAQLVLMLNELPVDITFVDEHDEVRYFSGARHRIFPRSKAIIGRKVQNCHPPESVHIVNEIVEAFRNGTKSHADFWIKMKGRFIHIRYFALRDEQGCYKGTIEVSQDATEIRALEGEQRLLDWNK